MQPHTISHPKAIVTKSIGSTDTREQLSTVVRNLPSAVSLLMPHSRTGQLIGWQRRTQPPSYGHGLQEVVAVIVQSLEEIYILCDGAACDLDEPIPEKDADYPIRPITETIDMIRRYLFVAIDLPVKWLTWDALGSIGEY